ncbi:MAG: molybdopterin-dependent oxidoreductase, partial [Planctomycetales bacterium]|nr:molybdopterin-dependent oxidoreductase [Planctomycetales bacterium]
KILEAPLGSLEVSGGRVVVKGTDKSVGLFEAAGRHPGGVVTGRAERSGNYRSFSGRTAGVQFAEVEVDTETGYVRVVKVVAVHDCGRIVNRLAAESQVIGGVVMGLSYALMEERIMDHRTGLWVNPDLENYKVLGCLECPEIEPVMLEVWNAGNATGVMGLGEPPVVPTAGAVANAVANAIGARVRELPITPARVLEALGQA